MSFKELDLKTEYRSFKDDIVKDFYLKVLKHAVLYKRAVGFFSSTALIELSAGIINLIKNDGKIQLIVSPKLSQEDINAIEKGYEERKTLIERILSDSFDEPKNYYEEERLNLLANLIADGRLDIKVAVAGNLEEMALYHEKIGIIYDDDDNIIAFTGSMNETFYAFKKNYESIDVFTSWTEDRKRVLVKEEAFNNIWANDEIGVEVLDFPMAIREKILSFKKDKLNLDLDSNQFINKDVTNKADIVKISSNVPTIPEDIKLYDYQLEAIQKWKHNDFIGIFDMATGTGKTITGISALVNLYENSRKGIATIIVCPYQHLVEQWVEDLIKFNIKPIIGYSASKQKNWKDRLKNSVIDLNIGIDEFFCFITTNATFDSDFVKDQIKRISKDILLIVDEAHNFGANKLSMSLNEKIKYRLALSATLERHGDEIGTNKLYDYFGEKCIEYTLERAISEKKLTQYYYYPILTYLTVDELEQYKKITREIIKRIIKKSDGSTIVNESAELLLIKRARLVAGATDKLYKLKDEIYKYKDEKHMLIYCGATNINFEYLDGEEVDIRQIDMVSNILGNELNMKVAHFTSRESSEDRAIIKKEFDCGKNIQALIAIKCLDEGVNIPNIQKAFILASSTNPKEYIQRRGRVLRRAKGKEYAYIFDFITLPRRLEEVELYDQAELKYDLSLVKKEINRMKEFASICENPIETDKIIYEISEKYDLFKIGDDEYEL